MTIDEKIAQARGEAEILKKAIETGYYGGFYIPELYQGNEEAIKSEYEMFEHLKKEHEQLAEWLEELKDYRENSCYQCDYGECHEYHEKSLIDFFQQKKMRLETRQLMIF